MSKKHNYKSVLAAVRTRLADATYHSGTLLPRTSSPRNSVYRGLQFPAYPSQIFRLFSC